MKYMDFASKISFYEFLQSEFKPPHFKVEAYKEEIELLSKRVNIEYLTKVLKDNPKAIDICEELLQLQRFTNTQYINFCFDVNTLNNAEEMLVLRYINENVFKFENGQFNAEFSRIYEKLSGSLTLEGEEKLFYTKRAIVRYAEKVVRSRKTLYEHLKNSIGARLRVSRYLIENLDADELLSAVNLEAFLRQKRRLVDTRMLHGKFGSLKISKIFEKAGIKEADSTVRATSLSPTEALTGNFRGWTYVQEKAIAGVKKRKDNKLKKFDFVLLHDGLPSVLIETNFYSTSGTKIGINQGEYVDLHEDVKLFNVQHGTKLQFMWVTDGNYWLSSDGEARFKNLKDSYFTDRWTLLNYKLLEENLRAIQKDFR
jgi:DNA-directed RNA polymerase subunit F